MNAIMQTIDFQLPSSLACARPTEERGLCRDEVRLLVTDGSGSIHHKKFYELDDFLEDGDVLVVNTSATQPAALPIRLPDEAPAMMHLGTRLGDCEWLVEVRKVNGEKTLRWHEGEEGMLFQLPGGVSARLERRLYKDRELLNLWRVGFSEPITPRYLEKYGAPIRYDHLKDRYPLDYYQTFFSFHPGSSEMPSAGRGFTPSLVDRLLNKGVVFAPLLLHTGVSSLEEDEQPYPEFMEIDPLTCSIIYRAKSAGKRVIAVGTTAVRAVETAAFKEGSPRPYHGWTDLYIHEGFHMKVVDGMITGFHEPRASHLHMLLALAGPEHVERAYAAALENKYYWHQFGDLHLILT